MQRPFDLGEEPKAEMEGEPVSLTDPYALAMLTGGAVVRGKDRSSASRGHAAKAKAKRRSRRKVKR